MKQTAWPLLGASLLLVFPGLAAGEPPDKLGPAPKGFDARRDTAARGKVETLEYDSRTVGQKRKLVVYTPPGYSKDARYPVLYLLHGRGGNEANWTRVGAAAAILDNLYADRKLAPMIVVMPNGTVTARGGFESELLKDVIPFVESKYRVLGDREHRAVAGLSVGGAQSLSIGLGHPDRFAWVGAFSAPVRGRGAADLIKDPRRLRLLWVSCGDRDRLMDGNRRLHEALEEKKVPHVWHVDAGGHEFRVWKNDLYLLAPMLFKDR